MNREDVEGWVTAAREHPGRSAFLLLAALALVFLFGFAGAAGQFAANILDSLTPSSVEPPQDPAVKRSMPLSDWLDIQKQESGNPP